MKQLSILNVLRTAIALVAMAAGTLLVHAATTDIATVPMGTAPTSTVLPNLMFVLDDSGSMDQDYTPDQVNDNGTCKSCDSGSCDMTGASCRRGYPPYYAAPFNTQYYNPAVTYKPGVNYLGTSLGNMSATAVRSDAFSTTDTSTFDIATSFRDIWWCNTSSISFADLSNSAICKRNGVNTTNPFNYSTDGLPNTTFRFGFIVDFTNPHYYTISPTEHCTDNSLTVCTASTSPVTISGVIYDRPAPVRWCSTVAATTAAAPVTGGSPPTCRATVDATYRYPRYGTFKRFDILTGNTYFRANTRTDCTGAFGAGGCSYAEELQNFANWSGYYRKRILQMKTISGRVFSSLDERYRIGFLTINASSNAKYLPISKFETSPTTQKQDWFTKFYSQLPNSSTPLRQALSRVGRHYAGKTDGINDFMPEDPVQYACQPNYTLLTTDGYWNGSGGQKTDGTAMDNQDNAPGTFVSRATGTLDGVGTTVTESTPTVTLTQQVCTGNNSTTFAGTNTTCGCTGSQKRVKQQTRTDTSTTVFTDGVANTPAVATTYTFQDITACTTPLIVTTVTPTTRVEQQVITGNGTSTFAAVNGVTGGANQAGVCTGSQTRIKQRTTTFNTTVVTNDGAITSGPTNSGTAYAFSDPGSCIAPLVNTVVTHTTIVEQQVVTASANSTFSAVNGVTAGANQAGTCPAGQKRVKQRTTDSTSTVVTTNGVAAAPVLGATYSFADVGVCVSPRVVTAVTPVTVVDEQVVTGTANTTFSAINGVTTGSNQAGTCPAGQSRVKRRTTTYNSTVVTTDGVAAPATTSGTAYAFANIGACVLPVTTTTTTPVTEVQTTREQNTPTGFPAGINNGSTAQTTFTSCSGGQTTRIQRTLNYNKVDVQVGTGPVSTTYTAGTASFTTLNPCGNSTPAASGPTVTFGTPVVTTTGGPAPVAAASTTTNGATTTTSTGGPTPVAAATTTTPGATTNTTTGGPLPVAAATTNTTGTPVATSNGGTTVAVTMSPNPSVPSTGSSTSTTAFGGASNTLADVAMYYYKNDLRTTMADIVKGPNGTFLHQHMVTFTLGLGLDGQMLYDPNYDTATSGDFVKIKTAATGCAWTTGTCNWPVPVADTPTAIDDLWHAAVNGRGKYFSAKDPTSLENGLTSTLNSINQVTGAAASAATSTPNLTPTDNLLFSSTYRTQKWDGEIIAQRLDPVTGDIVPTPVWTAATQLNNLTTNTTDSRTIYTFDGAATSKLKSFLYASLTPTEQAFFDNKCAGPTLPQCGPFDPTRITAANAGTNLVNWLRGQRGNELSIDLSSGLYRAREFILGDTVNSKPVYVAAPSQQFADAVTPDYPSFKAAQASRQKVLYIAANDGMLHALNAETGAELWAYIPKIVMPNLWKLASKNYDISHNFYVDGSPAVMDVYMGGAWKTILVSGLNSGGRGYFALDITNPASPKGLWEICSDAALCAVSDADMGLSFGVPVITKRFDGTPIVLVTSGYNNVTPGDGGGYLYVLNAATGAVIEKVATPASGSTTLGGANAGNTTTPSGLAKISGFAVNAAQNNTATIVYGGDLLGNVWRFDMTASPVNVQRLATLKDGSTPARPQSITTRPEVTRLSSGSNVVFVGTGRLLGGSDLGDPAALTPPQPFAFQQTLYAIKDTGTDFGNVRVTAGANFVQQTLSEVTATTRTVTNNPVDFNTNNGWYVDFNPGNTSPGERVNLDPTLIRGVLVVTTNEPNTQACSDGGNGFLYQFNFRTGSYIPGTPNGIVGGQIASSLLVGSVFYRTTTGSLIGLTRSSTGTPIKTAVNPGGSGGSGQRVSWRELIQ